MNKTEKIFKKILFHILLTHFKPMFNIQGNKVVDLYNQSVWVRTPEWHWHCSSIMTKFEQISHLVLMFLLLNLKRFYTMWLRNTPGIIKKFLYFFNFAYEYLKKQIKKIIKDQINNCFSVDSLKPAWLLIVIPKKIWTLYY